MKSLTFKTAENYKELASYKTAVSYKSVAGYKVTASLKKIALFLTALVALSACNKNDADSPINTRNTIGPGVAGVPTSNIGYVTNNYDMTQQTKNFLSSGDANSTGVYSVNGSNAVVFNGLVRVDGQSNQMIPDQSYMNMRITYLDVNNQTQAYEMGIYGSQGYITYGYSYASANIKFEDQWTTINMVGTLSAASGSMPSMFTGDLYYYNKTTQVNGKLGQFRIQTCGFFNCAQ